MVTGSFPFPPTTTDKKVQSKVLGSTEEGLSASLLSTISFPSCLSPSPFCRWQPARPQLLVQHLPNPSRLFATYTLLNQALPRRWRVLRHFLLHQHRRRRGKRAYISPSSEGMLKKGLSTTVSSSASSPSLRLISLLSMETFNLRRPRLFTQLLPHHRHRRIGDAWNGRKTRRWPTKGLEHLQAQL